MPLQNYRDTFVKCLSTLRQVTAQGEDYARFRWQAVYLTRGRYSYFFRGAMDGHAVGFSGQQMDLVSGEVSIIPVGSVTLYGATFGLNEAIVAYRGPQKSVIEVAHAFNDAAGYSYDAEFFHIRMNLLHSGDDSQMGFGSDPRLRENTNLIFVGLEDEATARRLEDSEISRWMAAEKPLVSPDWYAERFYYS